MVEVIEGSGALEKMFRNSDGTSWLVLSGETSFRASGAAEALDPLLASGCRHVFVKGPLPSAEEADLLVAEIGADPPKAVLAVGGGLVIDTMKAVALALGTGHDVLSLLESPNVPTQIEIETIAVPTTAGSGAERTPFAVMYRNGLKYSLDDSRLLPDRAVLDPSLVRSMPRPVAASSALDALSHCVESMWACKSTPGSIETAAAALASIVENIEAAVKGDSDRAQEILMFSASEAGAAIATSRTTAAHALSYHLTSRYGISHGHAVTLTLGQFLALNGAVDQETVSDVRGAAHVRSVVARICSLLGVASPDEGQARFHELLDALGLPTTVDFAAGRTVDRGAWVSEVNAQRLSNNPRLIDTDTLNGMLRSV